jgi:cobyrinic acid a,c-diamide synthase
MKIPAIVIAGTNSGCGKTTLSMGLMAALAEKGFRVQPYKVGPDYIDPMFHTFITGRESRNLDSWMLDRDTVRRLYCKSAAGADIAVVEGVMGFYDGYGGSSLEGSTADVSKIIGAPVILVINGEAMSLSAAALVKGFAEFDKSVRVKGVLLNNISGEGHYRLLKEAIEGHTGITVLGYLERSGDIAVGSRHLGLVTSAEIGGLREKAAILSGRIQRTVDLELLVKLAGEAEDVPCAQGQGEKDFLQTQGTGGEDIFQAQGPDGKDFLQEAGKTGNLHAPAIRLAVARDKAFCFYYKDNLELLEELGAELVYFSPLEDSSLPEGIDGLYLGGGYPEVWARELQENTPMKKDIKSRIERGLPAYAECGGLMYLTDSIRTDGEKEYEMVGLIPGESRMTSSLKRFGYVYVKMTEDTILGEKASEIRAHEFHYSETTVRENVKACFEVSKRKHGHITKSWNCGYKIFNLLAGYPHLHFYANPAFARGFVESCRRKKYGLR